MLGERIFNFHDVVLIFVIIECLFLAIQHFTLANDDSSNQRMMTWFMLVVGAESVINLIMWNPLFTISPGIDSYLLPILFVTTQMLRAPLFLAYVKSFSDNFSFKRYHILHLAPALIAALLMLYFSISDKELRERDEIPVDVIRYAANFIWYTVSAVTLLYGIAAYVSIKQYQRCIHQQLSHYEPSLITWLQLLTFCFGVAWIWSFFVVYMANLYGGEVADNLGTFYNYILFGVTNGLVLFSYFHAKPAALSRSEVANYDDEDKIKSPILFKIDAAFRETHIHLQPNLNIEEFAEAINEPVKRVSHFINHEMQSNFFELINTKRIEVAKSLLLDPAMKHVTVLEISLMSGFNNKSSFHRFFNRIEGISPTEFRRRAIDNSQGFKISNLNKSVVTSDGTFLNK